MISRALRLLAALSLLATGAVHLQQYLAGYSSIPTIGWLFLLNTIGAVIVAIGLVAPLGALIPRRRAQLASGVLAAAGAIIAAGSLVALWVSENGTLFGFHESGAGGAIVVAIVAEVTALVAALPLAAICLRRAVSSGERPPRQAAWGPRSSPTRT